jgi:VWFA-related protein
MCFMALPFMLLLGGALLAQAQDQEPLFRAGVSLVRVDVQVTGRSGKAIADFWKEDFRILDGGQPVEIGYFARESEPLDLLLLLDVSGSMTRALQEMAVSARAALAQLRAGDRVGVMLFARRTAVALDLSADFGAAREEVRQAAGDKSLGAGTLLNDAVIAAAGYLGKQARKGRRAILIVTDNQGLSYQVRDEDVIHELLAADTVLNGIVVAHGRRPGPDKPGRYTNPDFTPFDVYKLAAQSGGEVSDGLKVGDAFAQMIERIRSRYAIHYTPPQAEPGTFRRIQVELAADARRRHGDAMIRARSGYTALIEFF